MSSQPSVIRVPPFSYIHILDNNVNVTSIVAGPRTYTRPDHVRVVLGPEKMITIPPRHYCVVGNPVVRDDGGNPVVDEYGQYKLRFGDEEVREAQDRFPLYPGESLVTGVTQMPVIETNTAMLLRAKRDFKQTLADGATVDRIAGEEWLVRGPTVFKPMVEAEYVRTVEATVVRPNQALRLRARRDCIDANGVQRRTGEEWQLRSEGAYLPSVHEVVVDVVSAYVLTEKTALHLRATRNFDDALGVSRRAGEEWLVTLADADQYIPDVYEAVVGQIEITTLTNRQYCVVVDPVDAKTGRQRFGHREVRIGERSFFLNPGERLESGIEDVYVLGEDEALVIRANQAFDDVVASRGADGAVTETTVARTPGDLWMIMGPREYFPRVEVSVVDVRRAIPLDDNEGIYVRNITSGEVTVVSGESYMIREDEELWRKELPADVEALLANAATRDPLADRHARGNDDNTSASGRDMTRAVTFRVPHNAAVQIYDYKLKESRVVFGPDLVLLRPDEQFTPICLSGDKPKRPNVIKSLALLLGPDFATDIITVETSDHARLSLQLSYNWHFDVDRSSPESVRKLFSISDFVGDMCKRIASRVRGAVAQVPFDVFHKTSATLIPAALFGQDDEGNVGSYYKFPGNNLVITSIDIQSVEPVDQRTRDSLQKSVQLAIQITTASQEATAKHNAARVEQEARGALERQRIQDEVRAEESRKELLSLKALSAAVASSGQATAEAKARAEAAKIAGESSLEEAKLKVKAQEIESTAELARLVAHQNAEVDHMRKLNELEVAKARAEADIETKRWVESVAALGPETIRDLARAGPETQVALLKSLGISSVLVTDGNSPINLFNTASGLIGSGAGADQ
ncbi:major vault protein [Thecamonas trahens ATCC 50062]|uniref:Major vault protein n=1 Tax=Thecamonas trahens ATCC 50062 TaxID=461836 RepID=A0A0L0DLE2_THETB|nr:major vault protein [Thecamonas trahens ATCC 50062]KNC53117.1 major vault protein [Thecamonas trahens ATCC 50062]|eukprot:XP_013754784.1 major vault protein [Thecamonas trahens ATCC 50062]